MRNHIRGAIEYFRGLLHWILPVSCFPDSFYSICCFVVAHNGVNLFKPIDIFTSSQLDQSISVLRVGGWDRLHFSGRSSAILF